MDADTSCSIAIVGLLGAISVAYVVRVVRSGPAHHPRVEAEGRSALLAKDVMEMMCWAVQPVVNACARLRITPDAVTFSSLALGVASGCALGMGHFGVGALLATIAAGGDAIDGLLARKLGVDSKAGELLDAVVDRYVDFALLGGVAFYYRADEPRLVLALLALLASYMVSYSTSKADALRIAPPRGSMRRVERSVLVVGAAALTPAAAALGALWADVPMTFALGMIAIVGNLSAARRLASMRASLRTRAREARMPESHGPRDPDGELVAALRAAE
ncbi:MAG: CDP-diacylglycerol--glycerol-3-phosphate 3-phosphatidyltransferase [Labilithrix sp.]|nr:CDP-diacylglycerol--glycerol-3-phosphate 3-phosphatidyltransferase [Labilithrix sp.]